MLLINRPVKEEKSELNQSGISPARNPLDKTIKSIIDKIRECKEEQENQDNVNTKRLLCLLHEEKVLKTYLIFCSFFVVLWQVKWALAFLIETTYIFSQGFANRFI